MTFDSPQDFQEAYRFAKSKKLLRTTLSSAQLSKLDGELKRRSSFSARLDKAQPLQTLADQVALISGGGEDRFARIGAIPEAKAQLKEALYKAGVPLAPVGTPAIKDFYSDTRRSLMVETNVLDVLGFGRTLSTQNPVALELNPAWELIRVIVPKGGEAAERDWPQRWKDALDSLSDEDAAGCTDGSGRLVALKNNPIWQALGDGEGGYEDTLGNPWPPFAFNSGMNTFDVARDDAIALGILEEDETVAPDTSLDLNANLEASAAQFDSAVRDALIGGGLQIVKGILKIANSRQRVHRSRDVLRSLIRERSQ